MKKIKLAYWIITSLFAAFMLFSAIPDIMLDPEAVTFITALGYPEYFIVFIGIAKAAGAIAILIPQFKRIKEWAYAGLFFDLLAAAVSIIATQELNAGIVVILLPVAFLFASYFLWHKLQKS
ncbi:MAG: DoxX family protein [Bacteroidetes bacterium]|nr:DoxX family protein [Bacteroidota bacterium]